MKKSRAYHLPLKQEPRSLTCALGSRVYNSWKFQGWNEVPAVAGWYFKLCSYFVLCYFSLRALHSDSVKDNKQNICLLQKKTSNVCIFLGNFLQKCCNISCWTNYQKIVATHCLDRHLSKSLVPPHDSQSSSKLSASCAGLYFHCTLYQWFKINFMHMSDCLVRVRRWFKCEQLAIRLPGPSV